MRPKTTILLSAVGLITIGAAAWRNLPGSLAKNAEDAAPPASKLRPIPTAAVCPLSGVCVRQFPGNVRATRRVQLAFSVPGLLEELYAQEGTAFRAGNVLARLDQRDYQHALDAARARYTDSQKHFARLTSLRLQNVAAEAEYDEAQAAHDVAKAELRSREKALEDTVLRAPFDGVVARRYVENHEHVEARQPILSLQDISVIEVVIQVSERLIARSGAANLGTLQVRFDADAERWFDAEVREFSVESDPLTRTFDVVVGLAPPADLEILPGMTATVRARASESVDVRNGEDQRVLVPVEAIVRDPDGETYAWIIDPLGGAPRKQPVDVGILHENGLEILSGLQPGQHVAIAGLHTLRDNLLVRPMVAGGEGLDG